MLLVWNRSIFQTQRNGKKRRNTRTKKERWRKTRPHRLYKGRKVNGIYYVGSMSTSSSIGFKGIQVEMGYTMREGSSSSIGTGEIAHLLSHSSNGNGKLDRWMSNRHFLMDLLRKRRGLYIEHRTSTPRFIIHVVYEGPSIIFQRAGSRSLWA